ncbi:SH3 domain-containing protein [Streptomyces sp. SCSIO ZS0520]|uniref:SH3 domain-containing protein n=1 Tax=Streptomyces sp. SCSIO ZS0520 TaxID=2892996 RepID=UPI0021D87B40|nr:SH3 domain-containing protein [Streptomyces sp. SCSIO ZS0520]
MNSVATIAARGARLAAAGGLVSAMVFGATAGIGATAQAAVPSGEQAVMAPAKPYATVTTKAGLNKRQFPSTDSSVRGFLPYRAQVGVVCKVRAQNIAGNDIWYLVRDKSQPWISAKYAANTGYVKYCKDVLRSKVRQMPRAMG